MIKHQQLTIAKYHYERLAGLASVLEKLQKTNQQKVKDDEHFIQLSVAEIVALMQTIEAIL